MGDLISLAAGQETPEQALAEREPGELPADVDPCTDLANAYRLASMHEGDLLFARSLGWLAWDGRRYLLDELGVPWRHAQSVARAVRRESSSVYARAAKATSEERQGRLEKQAKELFSWGKRSQQERALRSMLTVASTLETFAVLPSAFDTEHMALNVQNGTVDLRTGQLRDHDKTDRITKLAPVELRDDWGCPTMLDFLGRIFDGNEELIGFVQRAVGYSLTGRTDEQCFFLLHGTGSNGKSTLLEVLRHVLGDYALNTSADALMMTHRGRGPDNDIARLRGARLVTASESGEKRRLDEERVKRLTGGDTVTARFLHREYFEFQPLFKLWLAANAKPEIQGTDHGMWRRVRLIPFAVQIPEHEKDPRMSEKLKEEAPGILAWAVEGCLAWLDGGLQAPAEVTDATAEYRADEDVLTRFIEDECIVLDQAQVSTGALYTRYADWCREQGESPMSSKALSGRVKNDGRFRKGRSKHGRFWTGLGLRARNGDCAGDRSGDR
jgi:putative DNA primase/helicase